MGTRDDAINLTVAQPKVTLISSATEYSLIAYSFASTLIILAWLMVYCQYGFDFTDESFYLVWSSAPSLYDWSLSQFGFLYHPFYILFSGNIALLRIFNMLVTFALAWYLVDLVMTGVFRGESKGTVKRLSISFGFAASVLVFYGFWAPSPSYNSLNLQALLVVAIGLLLARKYNSVSSVIGWILVGAGGWLTFMAKPSSAAVLGVCLFFYLLIARKINFRLLSISVASGLLLLVLSAMLIDGSLMAFVERLQTGIAFAGLLGGGHSLETILRIDDFTLSQQEVVIFRAILMFSVVASSLLYINNNFARLLGLCFAFMTLGIILLLIAGKFVVPMQSSNFHGLLILAVPASTFILALGFGRRRIFTDISLSRLSASLVLALFPYIYAFGTNNNYWQIGGAAGFFWVLSALIILVPLIPRTSAMYVLFPLLLITHLIVVVLVQAAMELPYRQTQPLRMNSQEIIVGRSGSSLILSEGYASYILKAQSASKLAGFQPATPIIDLSGQSPGILYALGATNVGQAWMIGGYPGSLSLAAEALKRVSCEYLASAWLLTEPGGPRSISYDLVATFGAQPSDYELVASWDTANGAGGFDQRPTQMLLKPNRDVSKSISSCTEKRTNL
ncbi:MAG: hypothetical protein ACRD6X_00405 [Pyrinomonadaceae bacterium]|uniref:hypothetical protein n=1 Tax=Pseudomonas sp. TaxID=306 RepID=UPI003D6FFB0F